MSSPGGSANPTQLKIESNVPLVSHTSWLIGGKAEWFVQPQTLDELKSAIKWASENKHAVTVISGGSNVLISDDGIDGLTIHMGKFTGVIVEERGDHLHISAHAGTSKSELLKVFLRYKLAPALFLAGLPGDIGGGVAMNAGVSENLVPREFVQIIDWIRVLRGQTIHTFTRDQLKWSYRHCEGWKPGIIIEVGISWPLNPDPGILQKVREANASRLKKQPLDKPSCGSVFVNPDGAKAGQLIESVGLKGHQIGNAQISDKHANFIVNLGGASAKDVKGLIELAQKTVLDKTGYRLKTEVVYLGKW